VTEFNLRQLVRDTIRTSKSVEWDDIAHAVMAGMSPESHRAALAVIDSSCKGEEGIGRHLDGCKCSPYRIKVDQRRTRTLLTHPEWKPGHSLNDGMRVASKELLKDLWREAKRIHEETS
jgi:hypothetical protein